MDYIKLIAGAVVIGLAGWLIYDYTSTKRELSEAKTAITQLEGENKRLAADLVQVTQDAVTLREAVRVATEEREKVQADLNKRLRVIRQNPAPQECKAAVNWVRQNKELLR